MSKPSEIRFGTGGWRAIIGDDFYKGNLQKVAFALAQMIKEDHMEDKPVAIGYDRRFLSSQAAQWVTETLCTQGIHVLSMPRSTPTPLIMFMVLKQQLHYGVEITASHNPAVYNGFKLIVEEGRDAPVETTNRLEEIIRGIEDVPESMTFEQAKAAGLATVIKTPFNDFIDSILSLLDVQAIRERGPRILFDSMHGSAIYPMEVIFNTTRCTLDQIHNNKDAFFGGIVPAPNEGTLTELRAAVIQGHYDLGIAVDGDGDRLGIIDATGAYISANDILVLLYYYLHEIKGWKGPVVRNLCTTILLDKMAHAFGEECYEVPVGFKYISSKIDEVDAVLGGESSGGLTVRHHIHGKDSVYAGALFVEMMCKTNKQPSVLLEELHEKYGRYVMKEANLSFLPERKETLRRSIMEDKMVPAFEKEPVKISYMDGCKCYFDDDASVTCRFSGTEPLLRIFAEGTSEEEAEGLIHAWRKLLNI